MFGFEFCPSEHILNYYTTLFHDDQEGRRSQLSNLFPQSQRWWIRCFFPLDLSKPQMWRNKTKTQAYSLGQNRKGIPGWSQPGWISAIFPCAPCPHASSVLVLHMFRHPAFHPHHSLCPDVLCPVQVKSCTNANSWQSFTPPSFHHYSLPCSHSNMFDFRYSTPHCLNDLFTYLSSNLGSELHWESLRAGTMFNSSLQHNLL